MKIKTMQKKSAFTLIELLVVVAIIGILAAVGVPAYSGYQASAKAKANLNQVSSVISLVANEAAKVGMGGTSAILGTSAALNDSVAIKTALDTNDFKNPYAPTSSAISSTTLPSSECGTALLTGKIGVVIGGKVITITSCDVDPANEANGVIKTKTITIE